MHKRLLPLSAASLTLALAFLACALPGADVDSPPGDAVDGTGPGAPADPSVPTNTDGAETIVIPGGTFWIGSEESDAQADEDERPRHEVTVGTFPIYTHEVTNAMYARCVEAGACWPVHVLENGPTSHHEDPAFADHPVVGVDWNMADDYCAWAGGRLPTEAEWEYAARGADSLTYPWGAEAPACDRANMLGCLVPPDTAEVGSYERGNSPFEVWDLAGNVWEWTHDWYDPDYYALSPAASPLGPDLPDDPDAPQKVVRGGGLQSQPGALRSAERVGARPMRAFDDVGFRCVAQPALEPSPAYAGVPDLHETAPPDPLDGGGELVEDPDDAGSVVFDAGCEEGAPAFYFSSTGLDRALLFVEEDGVPLTCTELGPDNHVCTGISGDPGTRAYLRLFFDDNVAWDYDILVPFCGSMDRSFEGSVTATCPGADGLSTVTFTSSPPITVETAGYEEEMTDGAQGSMPCARISDSAWECTFPATVGSQYTVWFHGLDPDGVEGTIWYSVPFPDDCLEERYDAVIPVCEYGEQVVGVLYTPTSRQLTGVSTSAGPLHCIRSGYGIQICELPGTPGSTVTVTTCFEGEGCSEWPVTIVGCEEEVATDWSIAQADCSLTGIWFMIDTHLDWLVPGALVHWYAGDGAFTCSLAPGLPGRLVCSGDRPSDPGPLRVCVRRFVSGAWVETCNDLGEFPAMVAAIPSCWEEDEYIPATLETYGCHDATRIFFTVNTAQDYVVEGGFTASASDGDTTYSCSLHPTQAHWLYCSGDRPDSPEVLHVCTTPTGGDLYCVQWREWQDLVASIPDCASEGPPPEADACRIYNEDDCNAHDPPCRWEKDGNYCYTLP